jgi:hypothetical protein
MKDHRVDVYVDNTVCIYAWEYQKAKDPTLNKLMKELYSFTVKFNVDLKLSFIPTDQNPADGLSRKLSAQDCMLSREKFLVVEAKFVPHQVDLMALDSNVMCDGNGKALKHYTSYPSPKSDGIDIFSQTLDKDTVYHVYPPFGLIFSVLVFLREQC